MIKGLDGFMSSEGICVDSAILENNNVEDLVQKGGMSPIDLPKTRSMPSVLVTVDTRELYRNMMESSNHRVVRMVARNSDDEYYGAENISNVIDMLYEGTLEQVTFRHIKVMKLRKVSSKEFFKTPVKDLESISRATKRSFAVYTADGEKFASRDLSFVSTRFFRKISRESIELFNKLVSLINDVRECSNVKSVYFTEPIELAYEHDNYPEALYNRDVVEAKETYSTFDSIHIADDGVYLRDASEMDGQQFLLFIPFDLFKKSYLPEYYDGFEEEAEYVDYADNSSEEDYDDGNHVSY